MEVGKNKATPFFIPTTREYKRKRLTTSKVFACFLLIILPVSILVLGIWNYTIQKQVNKLQHIIDTFPKVSITQTSSDFAEKELLKRTTRNNGQHFESIHLSAIDGGRALYPPRTVYLKKDAVVKNLWQIREKTPGIGYDAATGKIKITQAGFYRIYAQIRLSQRERLADFVTYSFHVNSKRVATALWNTSDLTQSLSTVVKLSPGDEVWLQMGKYSKDLLCYCKERFTYFGLFFISD